MNMRSNILIMLNVIFLQGCDLDVDKLTVEKIKKNNSIDFKPPMGPYGLPYRAGNLGGKAVNLGEGVSADYEECPIWEWGKVEPECKTGLKRNYDSLLSFITFKMRYTDGRLLVTYIKAPQAETLKKEYKIQNSLPDTPWVNVFAYAANRYVKDGDMWALLDSVVHKKPSTDSSGHLNYIYVYTKTDQFEYGLQKYIPDQKWIAQYGYKDTKDLYVFVDKRDSRRITIIYCRNHYLNQICEQSFIMEPEMRVFVEASFSKNNLKDWMKIQHKAKEMILSFTVKA